MADEKVVVIKLELDVNEYSKKAVELNKEVKELSKAQSDLRKTGKDTTLEYQKNAEKLRNLNGELRQTNKVINDVTNANKANAGSNEQLRAQLSVLTLQYNKLSNEERTTSEQGKQMAKDILLLTDTLKGNESAVGDNRRNVGNYAGALKELKAELKLAKDELVVLGATLGEESKEFKEAQARAGELNDRIKDVQESTNALTGEPIEKMAGSFGLFVDKLKAGDFKGASAQIGSIVKVSKEMTFKQALGGIGQFTKSLGGLAKAILLNPLFLLAGLIIGTVVAVVKLKDSLKPLMVVFDAVGDAIGWVVDKLKAFSDAMGLSSFAFEKANQSIIDNSQKTRQIVTDNYDAKIRAAQREHKEVVFLEIEKQKAIQKSIQMELNALSEREKVKGKLTEEEIQQQTDLMTASSEAYRATADAWATYQDKQADKAKETNDKLKSENDKRAADEKAMLEKIENQRIELIKNAELRAFAKAVLDNRRAKEEIESTIKDGDLKNAALAQQAKVFESQLTQINQDGAAQRKANVQAELAKKKELNISELQMARDKELNLLEQQKLSTSLRIQVIEAASNLTQQIYEKERALKVSELQAELDNFAARKALGQEFSESEKLRIENLKTEIDLINQEYNDKEIADEKAKQAAIDKTRKDALAQKQADFERDIEISKIFLSSLNDLLYIFGANQDEMAGFAKTLALFTIALDTAKAISGVVAMSTEGDPYTYALRVATGIATVIGNVAQAKQLITGKPRPANIQQFAEGGQVLSGQKIERSHGKPINMANGDNVLASVKVGEVVLNERQQALLGGSDTLRRIGVPGFADGGLVARSMSAPVENNINVAKQMELAASSIPRPIVYVQDISQKQSDANQVEVLATV